MKTSSKVMLGAGVTGLTLFAVAVTFGIAASGINASALKALAQNANFKNIGSLLSQLRHVNVLSAAKGLGTASGGLGIAALALGAGGIAALGVGGGAHVARTMKNRSETQSTQIWWDDTDYDTDSEEVSEVSEVAEGSSERDEGVEASQVPDIDSESLE